MTVALINRVCKEGMTVFDVGANVGCHTFRFAKLVGQGGKVIAFEPMAVAFNKLERNLELNKFDNITLEKMALSNEDRGNETVYFNASYPVNGNWSHQSRSAAPDAAEVMMLDTYLQRKGISKVDLIKLDVDGYEYKVIQGGIHTIKKFKPIIIAEFGRCTLNEYGDNLEGLVDLLSQLGYAFYSEEDFREYSKEALLKAVPPDATINVWCQPRKGQTNMMPI